MFFFSKTIYKRFMSQTQKIKNIKPLNPSPKNTHTQCAIRSLQVKPQRGVCVMWRSLAFTMIFSDFFPQRGCEIGSCVTCTPKSNTPPQLYTLFKENTPSV